MARVEDVRRYPVKGLSGESLSAVELAAGGGVPGDRRLALARPGRAIDPNRAAWADRRNFVTLIKTGRLAELQAWLDDARAVLTLTRDGASMGEGCVTDPAGRRELERYLLSFLAAEATNDSPFLVDARTGHLTDADEPLVSLVNLASVADLAEAAGTAIDPRRFRANVLIAGLAPWVEREWVGREVGIGGARLEIDEETERCAVTTVNPNTGARDLETLKLLRSHAGHINRESTPP